MSDVLIQDVPDDVPSEASIFTAADGRWHGWITLGTKPNGETDRRHRTARTRAEVVKKIRCPDPGRWTVALALGLRQSEALAQQWKATTYLAAR